jgi:very-short-patch-repair endonuclease
MRLAPTCSEALLWQAIRGRRLGVQFRRQVPLGRYIADFFASELQLVIEIDGGYHHRLRALSDARRDQWLRRRGCTVPRLSEAFVMRDLAAAVVLIRERIVALRG